MKTVDLLCSEMIRATAEMLTSHERRGEPVSDALAGDIGAGLFDIYGRVAALEVMARVSELYGPRDYMAAVRELPTETRRGIAAAALARVERRVLPSARYARGGRVGPAGGDAA